MTKTTKTITDKVLITGAVGFIGFHLAMHYRKMGMQVIGVDKHTDSSTSDIIRHARKDILTKHGVIIEECNLAYAENAENVFAKHHPSLVFHFAALSGARCTDRQQLDADNIIALVNVLSAADINPPKHFLFSSSSSVYGENSPRPFCENTKLTTPDTPYASSKFAGEIAARVWARNANFPITIMRFFNVYGPWGRTNMAPFIFAECLAQEQEVKIISGDAERSWLYINDAISACGQLAKMPSSRIRTVNIAGPHLVKTTDILDTIAQLMGRTPRVYYQSPKIPEVTSNPANLQLLESLIGKKPQTTFDEGIKEFINWYTREWSTVQNKEISQ